MGATVEIEDQHAMRTVLDGNLITGQNQASRGAPVAL